MVVVQQPTEPFSAAYRTLEAKRQAALKRISLLAVKIYKPLWDKQKKVSDAQRPGLIEVAGPTGA